MYVAIAALNRPNARKQLTPPRLEHQNWKEVKQMPNSEGVLINRTVTLWVHTEQLWRSLEAAVGLKKYEIGRFKEWAALYPKHFGEDSYDLDSVISWACEHGVPHTIESHVHFSGSTGKVNLAKERLTVAGG